MKHRRLPQHVLAIIDTLERLGATAIRADAQKRIRVTWRIAWRVLSALFACACPKDEYAGVYAARECNRVRSLCGLPARGAA